MEKIALFFDKFGWIFIVILFMALGISAAAFATKDVELSERIEKLEGCCDEVHQFMEAGSGADETKIMEYVDQRLSEEAAKQTEAVSKQLESKMQTMKKEVVSQVSEEITAQVSETISEQVKNETQKNSQSSKKTGTSKRTNTAGSSQTSVSVESQTNTTITTQSAAESTYQGQGYDPDDKHFKVGSGDEEED
ncbi:MAG: hypothetical protein K6E75_06385 [Lachnospiraceae bacterium]|nr:hypothetical protein [Lachnospiraceae bacterium]